jgi:DhnA family fructose-bisphosphate aldolase class Ia
MDTSKWNRIFGDDGRALIVPIDHTTDSGITQGWEIPAETIQRIIAGKPDAIMTNYGILKQFRHQLAPHMGMLLRLDGGESVLRGQGDTSSRWEMLYTIEDAARLGVDGAIVMGLFGGESEFKTIQIIARAAADAHALGFPFAVEALPVASERITNVYDPALVATVARLAAEYGADFVKTYWTGSAESFRRVVECCPVPVLIAGGARLENPKDALKMVRAMLEAGGRGVFFGRNVWQHPDPAAMLRALRRVIHEDASVEEALEELAPLALNA